MNAIVVVDQNWGIGQEGNLLFDLPTALKHFRQMTLGSTVIMGCRTLKSLPNGKPLPKRENVVLTKKDIEVPGATVIHTPEEAMALVGQRENVFVMGGGSVYAAFLPHCKRAYVTRVEAAASAADTFFPNLDKLPNWTVEAVSEPVEENGFVYRFYDYVNRSV